MKAMILSAGLGSRLGDLTRDKHKSMLEIKPGLSLVEWQIEAIAQAGIRDFVIAIGHEREKLSEFILSKFGSTLNFEFVYNPQYLETNYIYSLYLARKLLQGDLLLTHGDLYFTTSVVKDLMRQPHSRVVSNSLAPIPEKDFKAKIEDGLVKKITVHSVTGYSQTCYPLYKLDETDWSIWCQEVVDFCDSGRRGVYAEEALNATLNRWALRTYDIKGRLCMEVDNQDDLSILKEKLKGE